MKTAWKIFEYHKQINKYKTLFHGINGSRTLEYGEILANMKENVSDGSSNSKYLSGIHVIPNFNDAVKYLKKFKKRTKLLCIKKVLYYGKVWEKEHSPSNVLLVEKIKLDRKESDRFMFDELVNDYKLETVAIN